MKILCKLTVLSHRSSQTFYQTFRNHGDFKKSRFFDKLRIYVRGGAGGQGFPKIGGIGGKGGDVIIRAVKGARFEKLIQVNETKRYTAATGGNSSKRVIIGTNGEDQIIPVPIGVVVRTDDNRILGDLDEEGQEVIAAHGAEGGGPKNGYLGKRGEALSVTLDLKLIADIGLVGFPNAGKSTFLSSISRAKPKIAEYPFTTIRPQIGTMEYEDFRKITVADLPGLIEGAHINYGMGHKFLKHVERTKLLLFMVDINGFQLKPGLAQRSAFETILLLNKELELYNPELLRKPAVIALNKIDTDEGGTLTDSIVEQIKGLPATLSTVEESVRPNQLIKFDEIYKIATMFDLNTEIMKDRLRCLLDAYSIRQMEEMDKQDRHHKTMLEVQRQETILGREHNEGRLV